MSGNNNNIEFNKMSAGAFTLREAELHKYEAQNQYVTYSDKDEAPFGVVLGHKFVFGGKELEPAFQNVRALMLRQATYTEYIETFEDIFQENKLKFTSQGTTFYVRDNQNKTIIKHRGLIFLCVHLPTGFCKYGLDEVMLMNDMMVELVLS